MPLKRKIRNLPNMNDDVNMSFFDPVYQNDMSDTNESNETITNNDNDQSSEMISTSKIFIRIKQIQNSIEQARTMLESMEDIVPGNIQQREKLYSIISNLEEQQVGYINLLNLISVIPEDHTGTLSETEQTNRNDNSNYDSLIGSLKSDTIICNDQQSTSADEESERNLMIQKEQFRALQGQKRALLAIKRRSDQEELANRKSAISEESHLLSHIKSLRNRLKLLRDIYEQKNQIENEQLQNSSIKSQFPTENRLKNLEHVRERLDELEQIITYYQNDDKEQSTTNNNNTPKHLDTLSNELEAKRLELEQAKTALNQLQEMVKTIQPDEYSSSARSTPRRRQSPSNNNNNFEVQTPNSKPSLLSDILSPLPRGPDIKMAAQHREIERLVESRQRLHTIKGQISSLHQSMTTPIKDYEENLNDFDNLRPLYRPNQQEDDNRSELDYIETKPRIIQSNLCVPESITSNEENNSNELNLQMREICRCLSTFIDEQKSFNHHIEERLTTTGTTNPSIDPVINQLQQQTLTQGLIVNLNTAYREIAVLQSEINALQSENNRLASSISFDNQYHQYNPHTHERTNSKDSIYSLNQIKSNNRPEPRSTLNEQNHLLTTNNLFEDSSKTSFNSQSSGKQTAIHVDKIHSKTIPNIQQRNAKYSTDYLSSSSPAQFLSKSKSDTYDRRLSEENLSKSFIIRRRPLSTETKTNHLYNYKEKLDEQSILSSVDEQQLNTHPSSCSKGLDLQTLDLQVKSAMVQLIPFMRLHINEIFNETILNHIRDRIIFLFKQQPDSSQLIRYFQNQFSELLEITIEKYCGTTIRDCAADLIRDISDVAFDELIKYKMYENTLQPNLIDDGENENKYQIELAASESRPLTLIGSDEEDNDSDQEENKDNELETAVSRQESDDHEYVLVNRSTSSKS